MGQIHMACAIFRRNEDAMTPEVRALVEAAKKRLKARIKEKP